MKKKELVETLCDVNEMAELVREDYPSLSEERRLAMSIALVQANAMQNINETLTHGLVVVKNYPSGLEAIAMALGFDPPSPKTFKP